MRTCLVCGALLREEQKLTCSRICNGKRAGGKNKQPIESRFWPYLRIADNGCWEWMRGRDQDGYGNLRWGKEQRTNRIAWLLVYGAIPKDKQVLHRCDNPPCCNPLHLFLGTDADNKEDMWAKGRGCGPRGELSAWAKLTEAQVQEIRRLHQAGVVQRRIAEQFGVGFKAISKIVLRQRWTHVNQPVGS